MGDYYQELRWAQKLEAAKFRVIREDYVYVVHPVGEAMKTDGKPVRDGWITIGKRP